MRIYTFSDETGKGGAAILIYGEPGSGKTHSLGTLPDPILVITTEPRDPRLVLKYAKNKKIEFAECDNFDELMSYLNELYDTYLNGKGKYKSVCLDSLSFEQTVFKLQLEDSRYDMSLQEKKRESTLIDRFKIERADWGGLGSMMKRLTWLLNRISKFGVYVVATATVIEYPRYNKELTAAPAFQGMDFSTVFNAYFDFIGFVQKNEPNPYPPIIRFISDGSFMAKSCSERLNAKGGKGLLDFEKIIKVIED